MRKVLLGLLMLGLVGIADAQWYSAWYAKDPIFNSVTLTGGGTVGTYLNVGTILQVGTGMSLLGKTTWSYNYSTASSDEDSSFSFISTGTAIGNSGKVTGLRSQYNWYGGDNATFTGEGLEGVVRSRAKDTNMTGRGVSGRIYAGTGYTMKTGIGVEAAYRIEEGNHVDYGSSYSALRAWCYPGWTTNSSTNVVNNYGIWVVNEHATNEIAAGMRFDCTSYGGKFTKDLQLQNGATIDNYTLANVVISTNTEVKGMMNVAGTATFASSVTAKNYVKFNSSAVFNGDAGVYSSAANRLDIFSSGVQNVSFRGAEIYFFKTLYGSSGKDANVLFGTDGQPGSPAYAFASDLNTGMYQQAANQLNFSVDGVTVSTITTGTFSFGVPAVQKRKTRAELLVITPTLVGETYYCSDDNTLWIASGTAQCAFKVYSGGATP